MTTIPRPRDAALLTADAHEERAVELTLTRHQLWTLAYELEVGAPAGSVALPLPLATDLFRQVAKSLLEEPAPTADETYYEYRVEELEDTIDRLETNLQSARSAMLAAQNDRARLEHELRAYRMRGEA